MNLATLSAQALAVRTHGGGLTPIQYPTQQIDGHPLRSKGGEINSLCCVAAGIIDHLLRAAKSHAYPTTCVRRTPFTAAPLRSQNRPPAQLVVGCKPPMQGTKTTSKATEARIAGNNASPPMPPALTATNLASLQIREGAA